MMTLSLPLVFAFFGLLVAAVAAVAFLLWRQQQKNREGASASALQQEMQNQLREEIIRMRGEVSETLRDTRNGMENRIHSLSQQLNERMKETSSTLNQTQTSVGDRLDNAAKVIGDLQNKLGSLEQSNQRILDVGQGLKELKDILKNPKLRGNMGEFFLEDLLRQILPPTSYETQYAFKSGEVVDAVIKVGDAFVSVDSKFPLETFVRLMKIPDDELDQKKREKKAFVTVLKKHADAIAKKYIRPDENTFDFAFMYIPAENVYYETIIRDDMMDGEGSLYSWLLDRKVIPVSPNSLYAYLQVIILGLKGMRVQESAKQILQGLDRLAGDLSRFRSDYTVLGKHIRNAGNTFDNAGKRLDRFTERYQRLSGHEDDTLEEVQPPLKLDEPRA